MILELIYSKSRIGSRLCFEERDDSLIDITYFRRLILFNSNGPNADISRVRDVHFQGIQGRNCPAAGGTASH